MKCIDAYVLARTKRKTRRIRLALVIIVSSLLFSVLFFGALVLDGVQQSAGRFREYGYNGRHITQANNYGGMQFNESMSQAIRTEMDNELRARKVKITDELRNGNEYSSEFSQRISVKISANVKASQDAFEKRITDTYHPLAVYHVRSIDALVSLPQYVEGDADSYLTQQIKQIETGVSETPTQFMEPPIFYSVEEEMLRPVLQQGQSFAWKQGDPYPVVLPYSYVERLAKKSFVGLGAKEKNAGYQELIAAYGGKTLQYCFRNPTAQEQLDSVLKYNHDAEKDKDASTKPLTVEPCKGFDQALLKKVGVIAKPDPDAPKPLFPKPAPPEPETRPIALKVVGFVPTMAQGPGTDIFTATFSSVNSWPSGVPMLIPRSVVDSEQLLRSGSGTAATAFNNSSLYVDFASREQQRRFIKAEGCTGDACYQGDKWILMPFGSLKTALEGISNALVKVGKWVALGVAILASLLVLFTISKLISDNRREIAVFRALGARQRDIAQIYFTYGFMLAGNAIVVSLLFAGIGAYVFSAKFADRFNAALVQAVGAYENPGQSVLLGVQPLWLLGIAGLVLVAATVGVAVPVLISRRRNLATMMREE